MNFKLSTESYKGVRDFYPEDKFVQEYIFSKMRKVAESFGYEKYDASILEPTDLYRAKTGEEIINEQTYSFTDRGGRDITLRPEMTPTIARMVSKRKRELSFPLRWYSIVNNFRYERPQKGRLREFWQLNVDMFGVKETEAEIEMIMVAYKIILEIGGIEKDFEIRISYAGLVASLLEKKFELDETEKKELMRLIDRWNGNKITDDEFNQKMSSLFGEKKAMELQKSLDNGEVKEIFTSLPETELLEEIKNKLNENGIKNIKIDPFLVRGFDYYTGMVFEVFDTNTENNRAMFGGGRYDNLLDIFDEKNGQEKIPAVGFGMGDATAIEFLKSRNLIPEYLPKTDVYLCLVEKQFVDFANDLACALRNQNLNVAVDYSYKKIDKQIKVADKNKIPFVICVGENEVKNDKFILKRMADGKEFETERGKIEKIIKEN